MLLALACKSKPKHDLKNKAQYGANYQRLTPSSSIAYISVCSGLNNQVIGMRSMLLLILLALAPLGCDHLNEAVVHEPISTAGSTIDSVDTAAPGTIKGHVIDAETGEVLPGTSVFLPNQEQGAAADHEGTFRIQNVVPGPHQLVARFAGYRTAKTSVNLTDDGAQLHITMKVLPVEERGDVIVWRCFVPDSTAERE